MSSEIMVALVVVVLFIGSLAYLEIHRRRNKGEVKKAAEPDVVKREQ